jgi:NADPH2:quinone reductase
MEVKAIRVHAYGGPEAMRLETVELPPPGAGQVRVRVEAAGVNFIDTYQRSGVYPAPALPRPLGLEGAGVVEALGPGVEGFAVGERVAWASAPGSYATHVNAPAGELVPVPAGLDAQRAAAAMLQGMTAHYLARSTFPLAAGHTCVVHAAAGGVGLLLCQLARAAGARVIGLVSTEEKEKLARAAGADEVIRVDRVDFLPEVRRLTGGNGVDVVYDSVGRDTFDRSLSCLHPRGMMVLFGGSSGQVPPFDPQILNARGSLYLTRPSLNAYTATREELLWRAGEVLGAVEKGTLSLRIDSALPLAEAAEAHRRLEGRKTAGKVLLLP